MILLVDLGNTRLKWAVSQQRGDLGFAQALAHAEGDLAAMLEQAWGDMPAPERVLLCCVAGAAAAEAVHEWTARKWSVVPERVVPERRRHGVTNGYADPQLLGADRWLAMIAARQRATGPCCIVDCGTAITLDVLDAAGKHLGGLIAPGLQMMRRGLLAGTAGIAPALDEDQSGDIALLARNTHDAVHAGTLYTAVAMIDRVTADVGQELGAGFARIICGGDAPTLLPLLAGTYRHEPDLVLHGLAAVAYA